MKRTCKGHYQFWLKTTLFHLSFLVGIYMFKVNNRNTITRCEIYSKLPIKTPERRHWRRSGVVIVNFEHISHLVLVLLLLTLSRQMPTGLVSKKWVFSLDASSTTVFTGNMIVWSFGYTSALGGWFTRFAGRRMNRDVYTKQ